VEQAEFLARLVRAFEALGVRYFVTGSLAAIVYGEPRLTADIDVVAELRAEHVAELARLFPEPDFYLSPAAAAEAIRLRDQFNILHPASGLKADVILPRGNEFDAERFRRARRLRPLAGLEASFSSPEDLIVQKLDFHRAGGSEKHLRDIAGILRVSGDALDLGYIAGWADRMGLRESWERLRGAARPEAPPREAR